MKAYLGFEVLDRMKELGMAIPAGVHLVGIRSADDKPDLFDDLMYVFGGAKTLTMPCTTNPGRHWLTNLLNKKGAAVVAGNRQYKNLWTIGLHQGKYKALVQANPVTVYRDGNGNDKSEEIGTPETGMYGINNHHANANLKSVLVGQWSAGCQVEPDPNDYAKLLETCELSGQKYFTYTLLLEW